MKQGNHWSLVKKSADKIRHKESKKYAKIETARIRKLAKASAKRAEQ
jgi:hypothetical protein